MSEYDDIFNLPTLKEPAVTSPPSTTTTRIVLDRAPDVIRRLATDREMLEHLYALAVDLFFSLQQTKYTNPELYSFLVNSTSFVQHVESMYSMSFFQLQQLLRDLGHQ